MKVFRSKASSYAAFVSLLSKRKMHFLILRIVSRCNGSLLRVATIVDNFLYLMFDMLLADRVVRVRGILIFGFLLAVKRF